jgi:hypothetical protein
MRPPTCGAGLHRSEIRGSLRGLASARWTTTATRVDRLTRRAVSAARPQVMPSGGLGYERPCAEPTWPGTSFSARSPCPVKSSIRCAVRSRTACGVRRVGTFWGSCRSSLTCGHSFSDLEGEYVPGAPGRALGIVYATTDVLLDECVVDASNRQKQVCFGKAGGSGVFKRQRGQVLIGRLPSDLASTTGMWFGNCLRHVTSVRKSARHMRGTRARKLMLRHPGRAVPTPYEPGINSQGGRDREQPAILENHSDRRGLHGWRIEPTFGCGDRRGGSASTSVSVRSGQPHGS